MWWLENFGDLWDLEWSKINEKSEAYKEQQDERAKADEKKWKQIKKQIQKDIRKNTKEAKILEILFKNIDDDKIIGNIYNYFVWYEIKANSIFLFFLPFIMGKIDDNDILNIFEEYNNVKIQNISEYISYIKKNILSEFLKTIEISNNLKKINEDKTNKWLNILKSISKKTKEYRNLKREIEKINIILSKNKSMDSLLDNIESNKIIADDFKMNNYIEEDIEKIYSLEKNFQSCFFKSMNEKNNINNFLKIFPKLKSFEKDFILFIKNILIYFDIIDKKTLNKELEIEIFEWIKKELFK